MLSTDTCIFLDIIRLQPC